MNFCALICLPYANIVVHGYIMESPERLDLHVNHDPAGVCAGALVPRCCNKHDYCTYAQKIDKTPVSSVDEHVQACEIWGKWAVAKCCVPQYGRDAECTEIAKLGSKWYLAWWM